MHSFLTGCLTYDPEFRISAGRAFARIDEEYKAYTNARGKGADIRPFDAGKKWKDIKPKIGYKSQLK